MTWVFGYGSLMWDGWEAEFDCAHKELASLVGFRRDFIKASVRNWGTEKASGPTLALTADPQSECVGMAFSFDDSNREPMLAKLRKREGSSSSMERKDVRLASGRLEGAYVPIFSNSSSTYLGDLSPEVRARMARVATGMNGHCIDYVRNIRDTLRALGVHDPSVERFYAAIEALGE